MLAWVLLTIVVVLGIYWLSPKGVPGIPGPTRFPLVGNLPQIIANRNDMFTYRDGLYKKYGNVYQFVVPRRRVVFTNEPEDIKWFLSTNFDNYKRAFGDNWAAFKLFGNGIFVSNGENWKQQRHIARDLFKVKNMETMAPVFVAHAQTADKHIQRFYDAGVPLDIYKMFSNYTMDCFTEIGFGYVVDTLEGLAWDKNNDTINVKNQFGVTFDRAQKLAEITGRMVITQYLPNREFETLVDKMNDLIYDIIRTRRKDSEQELSKRTDLLSMFMQLKDEKGEPFSDKYLRDIVFNFMIAGRDTTAILLTWTCYLLAQHPEVEEKMLDELREAYKDGSVPTIQSARNLKYTQQVLDETLRLYPSVPMNGRDAINDDVLPSGFKIPKGTSVVYTSFLLHKSKEWWGEDADKFDPSRWDKPLKHPFQYIPFHAGPQTCLGQNMAYLEAKSALAMVFRNYHFDLLPGHPVVPQKSLVMPPIYGVKVIIHKRKSPYSKELL